MPTKSAIFPSRNACDRFMSWWYMKYPSTGTDSRYFARACSANATID
jgi:hypothetical protein